MLMTTRSRRRLGTRHRGLRMLGISEEYVGVLDGLSVTGLVSAYDVGHRLLASYGNGPLCRIVRASDSAEQDFYALANGLRDEAAVTAFLAGTTGKYVTTYDQSGAGRHMTQATDGSRPNARSGVMNGQPVMEFDGVADVIAATIPASTTRTAYVVVLKRSAPDTVSRDPLAFGGNAQLYTDSDSGTGYFWYGNQASGEVTIGGSPINTNVIVLKVASASSATPYMGLSAGSAFDPNNDVTTSTTLNLGALQLGANRGDYDIPACLLFDTAHSDADRIALTTALQNIYGEDFTRTSQTLRYSGAGPDWYGRSNLLNDGAKWIHVYRSATTHSFDATSRLHIRFSIDEGVTWTAEDVFTDAGAVTGFPLAPHTTNGVAEGQVVKAPNGDLVLLAREDASGLASAGTYIWRSTDGGKTWTDEGLFNADTTISGGMETIDVIGSVIYMAAWKAGALSKSILYKSSDNGATWVFVSDATSTVENTTEWSFVNTTGNVLVAMFREATGVKTYMRTSTDLGLTWGALQDVTATLGVLHRARLKIFADEPTRIYCLAGDVVEGVNGFTAIRYSDDGGLTWTPRFGLDVNLHSDWGYADVLKRAAGTFYAFGYYGTISAASIYEYIFAKVP